MISIVGRLLKTLVLLALPAVSCFGSIITTYVTPDGTTVGGLPVDAKVVFTTSAGNVHIEITNNQVNPTGVIQNVSGLSFILSGGQTVGVLSSSSGLERNIADNGTYTDGAVVA